MCKADFDELPPVVHFQPPLLGGTIARSDVTQDELHGPASCDPFALSGTKRSHDRGRHFGEAAVIGIRSASPMFSAAWPPLISTVAANNVLQACEQDGFVGRGHRGIDRRRAARALVILFFAYVAQDISNRFALRRYQPTSLADAVAWAARDA
jgi:hypothetical protein